MSDVTYHARLISKLLDGMYAAGFSDGCFERFIKKIPSRQCGNTDEGLLRKLYLAHIGLADFVMKPGTVEMFSEDMYSDAENNEFRTLDNERFYRIHPGDASFQFDPNLDLKKLRLIPATSRRRRTTRITVSRALTLLNNVCPQKFQANYWHAYWFNQHQEFIPEKWKQKMRSAHKMSTRPRIIFPGVRLMTVPHFSSSQGEVFYPYLSIDTGGYEIKLCMDLFETLDKDNDYKDIGENNYFACFKE